MTPSRRAWLLLGAGLALLPLDGLWSQASFTVGTTGPARNVSQVPLVLGAANLDVTVTCETGVDCAQLLVQVQGAGKQPQNAQAHTGATAQSARFTVNASLLDGAADGHLLASGGGLNGARIPVRAAAGGEVAVAGTGTGTGTGAPPAKAGGIDVGELLTRDCSALRRRFRSPLYDAANDTARFIVTPVGNVLARPGDVIDENDIISVFVLGDRMVVPRLVVSRISDFRTPGQVHFVGEDGTLQDLVKADQGTPPIRCVAREFIVTDFDPADKGEVGIALVDEDGEQKQVGKFEFGVNTLYAGAFSFGPVRTELRDPEFGVVARTGTDRVTVTEDGTPRVLYVLSFTPFLWGRRELQEPGPWYTHINPTLGIVPAHLQENAIAGLSIDVLNSLYLQGGVHAGRVKRLDPRSGLRLGDEFTGTGDVPTVEEWDADWYVGVTVDLRAAMEFLRIAATGAGGG